MEKNRIIINADDFGMCKTLNKSVELCYQEGVLTSATIMAPTPEFDDAVERAHRNKGLGIGVHLTLTSEWDSYRWGPTLAPHKVPSLVDKDGYFHSTILDVITKAKAKDVYWELKNQIDICIKMGLKIDHLDNHMGSLMLPPFGKVYRQLAREYKLPIRQGKNLTKAFQDSFKGSIASRLMFAKEQLSVRFSRLPILDYLATPAWPHKEGQTYEDLFNEVHKMFNSNIRGDVDFFVHPTEETEEIKTINPLHWQKRIYEHQLLMDPDFKKLLSDKQWVLGTYKDFFG